MEEDRYLELVESAARVTQKQDTGLTTAVTRHEELCETLGILVTSKKEDQRFPVAISQQANGKLYQTRAKESTGFCEMNTAKKVSRKYVYQFLNEKGTYVYVMVFTCTYSEV